MLIKKFFLGLRNKFQGMEKTDYLKLVIALTGLNFKVITEWIFPSKVVSPYISLIITIVIALLVFFVNKNSKKYHSFEEGSVEEADFFNKWYKNVGQLIIFCTDLYWLDNKIYEPIKTTLKQKGGKLKLYLRQTDSEFVKELESLGAQVLHIKDSIECHHRFSIIIDDESRQIIIRNKNNSKDRIEFEEFYNDHAIVYLALDMLNDCV